MQETWDPLQQSSWIHRAAAITKRSRWFDLQRQLVDALLDIGVAVLCLHATSIKRRCYKSSSDTPLCSSAVRVVDDVDAEDHTLDDGGLKLADTTKAKAREEFSQRRAKQSTWHLVTDIICDHATRVAWCMMVKVGGPIWEDHQEEVHLSKAQRGAAHWRAQQACGKWVEVALRVAAVAGALGQLREIGFEVDDDLAEGDVGYDDEVSFSSALLRLQTVAIAGILRDGMCHSHTSAGLFAGWVSKDLLERRTTLGYGKALWLCYLRMEQHALSDPWCAEFLHVLLWPENGWIMQMMIGAWECNVEAIPPQAYEELSFIYRSSWTTLPIEKYHERGA